ncbi:ROK family protein [Salipaludibacillus neizhouensis]|uniref:ROK family protein n=1 Tax=Salipaludibacillus neizhouensis TaxID=885475 RepID=A0A3A9KN49_9BACI|nr:ROK family transcriptional regulator [Salipaludibacillus neizhouensis]RKL66156.1 ROK family protein [Salipaludibacillus neizhouensis]
MSGYQQSIKINNKFIILQTIRNHEPISRATISQQLKLTKATVSSLVEELISEDFCYQVGPGKSSGGRRPVMLQFNEKAGFSIGIDIGVNYILGILVDLKGNIVLEKTDKFNTNDYIKTMEKIEVLIDSFISYSNQSRYGVTGIGIGVPALVNLEGDILYTPNLTWENTDLKSYVENKYDIPVIIENEANAGAYGEKCFGSQKQSENLVYLSMGIGIGVGLILDNKLFRGRNGLTGEMGHMIIEPNGEKCSCGSAGCWELYASEKALLKRAAKIYPSKVEDFTVEELVHDAGEELQPAFDEIGYYLGLGLNNIINTFNPEQIIIGNRMTIAENYLIDSMMKVIREKTLPHHQEDLNISFSKLNQYSTALGAASFSIENFLKINFSNDISFVY